MADKPNLNARVHDEDRLRFKSLAKAQDLTDADFFSQLLRAWDVQGGTAPMEVPKELIGLQQTLGHVADIVRGIWAQAAADKKRLEEASAHFKKNAEDKLAVFAEELATLKTKLTACESARTTALEEVSAAHAAAVTADEERQTLFSLTQIQAERIRNFEIAEQVAATLPDVKMALEVTRQKLAVAEKREEEFKFKHAEIDGEFRELKRQFEKGVVDWQSDKDQLIKKLTDAERELAIYKERAEQLQARLGEKG